MAVTSSVYGPAVQSLANGEVDLDSDALKVMLLTSAYTPDLQTHRFKSFLFGEASGAGYTAGGQALTGVVVNYDPAARTLRLYCDDVTWSNSTITARYAVFYDSTPATDATRPLLCLWDFGADVVSNNGSLVLTMSSSGLLTVAAG